MRKFKWHILALIRVIIAGEKMPEINSKKIEPYCQKIVDALSKHGAASVAPFKKAAAIIEAMGDISSDKLKRQTVLEEMIKNIK
jgi:regulator of sigma D